MDVRLLVDAPEFWDSLQADLARARRRALVQTFTFEGDRVGAALGRALRRCAAPDRRLLVDGYSLLYHSDRLIPGPSWLDRVLRREVFHTHAWVRRLKDDGVGVRFGNPVGPSPLHLVRRNHKKLLVVDDVVYVGGINFSEHNFDWHDMMLRVSCPETADCLTGDFDASWEGRPASMDRALGHLRVLSLNGRGNPRGFAPVLAALEGARRTVDVQSAYLSHPFTHHLARAAARGVRVRILTPAHNNKGNLARHILESGRRHGLEVWRHDGMSHLKAMVVDEELLVAGSSNFDFMSYHILEELVVLTRDPATVAAYRERVWEPDRAMAHRAPDGTGLGLRLGHHAVRAGAGLAALLARS